MGHYSRKHTVKIRTIMELGQAATLNGTLAGIDIIVAKRKSTVEKRIFAYDYMSVNNYAFWMIHSEFHEKMIKSEEDVAKIKMPDLFDNYSTSKEIEEAYNSLRESFKNKDKSYEFDFIEKDKFVAIVKRIVKNTFEKVSA